MMRLLLVLVLSLSFTAVAGVSAQLVTCVDSDANPVAVSDVCTAAVSADPQAFCGAFALQFCASDAAVATNCPAYCAANTAAICGQAQGQFCPAYCQTEAATLCGPYVETTCGDVQTICKGNNTLADIATVLGDIEANCKAGVKTSNDTNVTCASAQYTCGASSNEVSCPTCPSPSSCPAVSVQPVCANRVIRYDKVGRVKRDFCKKWITVVSAP